MIQSQIIFNVVALLVAAFFLCIIGVQYFHLLPATPPAQQHVVRGAIPIEAAAVTLLAIGATANFAFRRLVIWSTFFVIAGYAVTVLLAPLAIWSWFVLREELDRTAR